MSGVSILAAGSIMDHLEPRYAWHWPGFEIHLDKWNDWAEHTIGVNPDITAHIVMMWIAALACLMFFVPVARSFVMVPRGLRNFLEPVLLYIRDEMVYPWLGEKDGRFLLPYFWTIFFFILAMNLIGLLPAPFGITATGTWNVTGALALMTLLVGIIGGMVKKGAFGYWFGLIPPGVPWWLWIVIWPIEVLGMLTKHAALMIRLFANMTAGHAIIAVLAMWLTFAPALVPIRVIQAGGSVAMILFEILIGLIQAYIFTILSAIYISLSLAEEH
ncbi:MAG: F0F1 ATP synthase subunit A [Planctomycetota bacterium]|jgi:F-type H+-transporting ATPase subunit a